MVGTRRRDPVRHGGSAAIHATVGSQLAARRQDYQTNADKCDYRDVGKGESVITINYTNNYNRIVHFSYNTYACIWYKI